MHTPLVVHTTTAENGEQLYCLDDICAYLGIEGVTIPMVTPGAAVYEAPSADGKCKYTFVTLAAMKEAFAEVNTPEARAMQYQITRGVYACLTLTGKVLFNAEDVALCLGYEDPDKAIKKYCKSAKKGFIDAHDVRRLVAHSTLSTAERCGAWIASKAGDWTGDIVDARKAATGLGAENMAMLRGTPIFW